ncbi:glycoside hydrolase family 43 protein [Pseudopedobacter beijingensis]|uniref:Glycoside hydrolase family 43 protein n=1 Tax=Pseudopedobacter beijingensis TaxID=1207056 RepID=A0ABW4I827_9SPHI
MKIVTSKSAFRKLSALIILISISLFQSIQAQDKITIKNPILKGFYPDPSIEKVGDDYYLINSTFSYFPGIPIFHSKDLKNWKQIGNIIDRPEQMDFMGERMTRGLFAPAISYHKGVFYVVCTDIDNDGNFVVTATNPAGPWSKPVKLPEVKGIDPSIFFDNDKAYIIYNSDAPDFKPLYDGHRTIRMYEFDYQNLRVNGQETILVNGGVDLAKKPVWIEGPHLYKRGEYYYLCAAEGGTSVNHSQVIFRSKDVKGPFIPWDKNPILTQRNLSPNRPNPITSTGHADLVEGPDGNTYAVFLAVRPYSGDYYNTGRETFIAPVKWTEDGWPIINPDHKEIQYEYTFNWKEQTEKAPFPLNGNFQQRYIFKDTIANSLLFMRTKDDSWYSLSKQKGLILKLKPETIMQEGNPAFIGRRQQHLKMEASTDMEFTPQNGNETAGIIIFQSEKHFYYMCKSKFQKYDVIQLYRGDANNPFMDLVTQKQTKKSAKVQLKIVADGASYSFYYAEKKDEWKPLREKMDGRYLSTKSAGGFVGCLIGVYASSNGQASTNQVHFKYLDYLGKDDL